MLRQSIVWNATIELHRSSELLKLLADPSRIRLLALLGSEELTVAELAQALRLKQPRVSTHLSKLKEAGLVVDRRAGVAAYYRCPLDELPAATRELWQAVIGGLDDAVLSEDATRKQTVLAARAQAAAWADSVAGDMERHYSPGRSWEALLRALVPLLRCGDVLDLASGDGVLAELLAAQVQSLVCVDISPRVVAAARERLRRHRHITVREGDMHALPLAEASVDLVLMLQALPYTEQPAQVFGECHRVLRPGGRLIATALARHGHRSVVAPYGHRNLGYTEVELKRHASKAGLCDIVVGSGGSESRPPHFRTLWLSASKD